MVEDLVIPVDAKEAKDPESEGSSDSSLVKIIDSCYTRCCCGGCNRQSPYFMVMGLMYAALLSAVIFPPILYSLVDSGIASSVVIDSTDAASYEAWRTNVGSEDVIIDYKTYFFDIVNPDEILKGAKPIVTQVGPYSYREYFEKFNISWTDDGDTVQFENWRYYVKNEATTAPGLTFEDNITLPYSTSLGFQYLMSGIDEHSLAMLEALVLGKLRTASNEFYQTINSLYMLIDAQRTDDKKKNLKIDALEFKLTSINQSAIEFFGSLYSFAEASNPATLILKVLLYRLPSGVSPFWVTNPVDAWFGWLGDPLLVEVKNLLDEVAPGTPWSTAVPGAAVNYTSKVDSMRRRGADIVKTGKKNRKQVGQYVKYMNMSAESGTYWICLSPMNSQDLSNFNPSTEFPCCELFHTDWTDAEAKEKGYAKVFATDFANRIKGTDASMFGVPVDTEKVQVFVSDIYRSLYLQKSGEVDWNGITLARMQLQDKDLANSTTNPSQGQYYQFSYYGTQNLTAAVGLPAFLSKPNFYGADPRLVAAITGLNPSVDTCNTHLDIEPQTGLLARASKKLQLNYYLFPFEFPTAEPDAAEYAHSLCEDVADAVDQINGIVNSSNVTAPFCNSTAIQELLTCLSLETDWNIREERIGFPFGWTDESLTMSDDTADDIKNTLYLIDYDAEGLRFWCLVIAGICFAMLCAMHINDYLSVNSSDSSRSNLRKRSSGSSRTNVENWATEPLLNSGPGTGSASGDSGASSPRIGAWGKRLFSPTAASQQQSTSDTIDKE